MNSLNCCFTAAWFVTPEEYMANVEKVRDGMRRFEMGDEQVEHFALSVTGGVFLDKDLFRDFRVEPLLFGELRQQTRISPWRIGEKR